MHSLRHFYYQNKEKIWKVVLIVILVLGFIYFINSQTIKNHNEKQETEEVFLQKYYSESNKTAIKEESAIAGGKITEKEAKKIYQNISKFLEYCKSQQAEQAYAMLSENCKQQRYSSIEKFKKEYMTKKFHNNQMYEVQSWMGNTYKVDILEDMLATGNPEKNNLETEYITIVQENNQEKLNINGYIGKESINKEAKKQDIQIKVLEKHTYMDYEEYYFEIDNKSNKEIKLDSLEGTGTIYLTDRKGNKYNAQMHEILEEEATIKPKQTMNLTIKFTSSYSDTANMKKITFEKLILDYNKYKKAAENEKLEDLIKFTIEV